MEEVQQFLPPVLRVGLALCQRPHRCVPGVQHIIICKSESMETATPPKKESNSNLHQKVQSGNESRVLLNV